MREGSLLCPAALLQADETERQRERKSIVCQKREAQLENAIPFLGMYHTLHGILQARIPEWGSRSLLQGNLPNSGMEPMSPALQADSLPAESPGKPIATVKTHVP